MPAEASKANKDPLVEVTSPRSSSRCGWKHRSSRFPHPPFQEPHRRHALTSLKTCRPTKSPSTYQHAGSVTRRQPAAQRPPNGRGKPRPGFVLLPALASGVRTYPTSPATSIPVVSAPRQRQCERKEEERRGRIQMTNVPCKFLMSINAFLWWFINVPITNV